MNARVFDQTRVWRLSEENLTAATTLLADTATAQFGPIDLVVGIAEGGRVPAGHVAARLGVPAAAVRARHNPTDARHTQANGEVWCDTGPLAPAGRVLVVDDICGSGATLRTVHAALTARSAPGTLLVTATLCRNAGADTTPDLWVWDDLRDWVVFPWEAPPGSDTVELPAPTRVHLR